MREFTVGVPVLQEYKERTHDFPPPFSPFKLGVDRTAVSRIVWVSPICLSGGEYARDATETDGLSGHRLRCDAGVLVPQ